MNHQVPFSPLVPGKARFINCDERNLIIFLQIYRTVVYLSHRIEAKIRELYCHEFTELRTQHFPANEMCCCLFPPISAQISSPDAEPEQESSAVARDRSGAVMHNFTFPEHCLRHPAPSPQPSSLLQSRGQIPALIICTALPSVDMACTAVCCTTPACSFILLQ